MRSLLIFLSLLAAPCQADIVIPPEFELQILDTTKGRIARPKGWFYVHRADKLSLHWVLSKEDTKLGAGYQTGMRIQFTPAASQAAKMAPAQFVERFVAQKQQSAEVKRSCPTTRVAQFQRRCLETVEGAFRILYSLFWSEELDAIVVTTFGAPTGEWDQARKIADRMNEFELLGEDFWKK
jgi:hypothetical protein